MYVFANIKVDFIVSRKFYYKFISLVKIWNRIIPLTFIFPPETYMREWNHLPSKRTTYSIESLFSKSREVSTGAAIFVFLLEMTEQEWFLENVTFAIVGGVFTTKSKQHLDFSDHFARL